MFKVMVMIKRKPGMSMADFINYYETRHAPLGASKLPGEVCARRFDLCLTHRCNLGHRAVDTRMHPANLLFCSGHGLEAVQAAARNGQAALRLVA